MLPLLIHFVLLLCTVYGVWCDGTIVADLEAEKGEEGIRETRSLVSHRGHGHDYSHHDLQKLLSYYKHVPRHNTYHTPSYGHTPAIPVHHTPTYHSPAPVVHHTPAYVPPAPVHHNPYPVHTPSYHQPMMNNHGSGYGMDSHNNNHNDNGHYSSPSPYLQKVYELTSKAISASEASQAISAQHHHSHHNPPSYGHGSTGHNNNHGHIPHMDTYTIGH